MSGTIQARYFDGHTPTANDVRVEADEGGLRIRGQGFDQLLPYRELHIQETVGREVRFGVKSAPDARLIGGADLVDLVRTAAPQVVSRSSEGRRLMTTIGGLVAASALVIGGVFFGAPMAAEPMARVTPVDVETTLGDNFAKQIAVLYKPCIGPEADAANAAIKPLIDQLAAHSTSKFPIEFSFVDIDAPNAMALPGGRVQVTRGLLETLDRPDELAAVIAHEVGHVEARDGLVALYRHVGVAMSLDIILGGSGIAQQAIILSGQVAEMRHSRAQEARADVAAIRIMRDAGYDPAALGRAFGRLEGYVSGKEKEAAKDDERDWFDTPEWLASHPDLAGRREKAQAAAIGGRPQPLSPDTWKIVRAACASGAGGGD